MNNLPPRRKIFFAGAAIAVCLSIGLGAGLPAIANASTAPTTARSVSVSTQAPTSTADLWAAAQSNQVQSPVDTFPVGGGVMNTDLSKVGVGLPGGFGNAGEIRYSMDYAPKGSAVTTVPTAQAANGLGGNTFPYVYGAQSAVAYEGIYVIPGTPTGTRTMNILTDPSFTGLATALDLSGAVYVMGADKTTGIWTYDQPTFSTQVSGSLDGTVSITSDRLNTAGFNPQPDFPSINLVAMTKSGNQVVIDLSFQLVANAYWDTSLSAENKVFDATVGQPLTISPDQMRAGTVWTGGSVASLVPTLSNLPVGSTPIPGGGLLYTPTAVGNVPFTYRLDSSDGLNQTQLMPAVIRVTDAAATPPPPPASAPTPPAVEPPVVPAPKPIPVTPPAAAPKLPVVSG